VEQLPFMAYESKTMSNPLIQIDDEIREMTDEEHAQHEQTLQSANPENTQE
jgi:hypothetical protein